MKTNDIKNIVSIVATVINTGITIKNHISESKPKKDRKSVEKEISEQAFLNAKNRIIKMNKDGDLKNMTAEEIEKLTMDELEFQKIIIYNKE